MQNLIALLSILHKNYEKTTHNSVNNITKAKLLGRQLTVSQKEPCDTAHARGGSKEKDHVLLAPFLVLQTPLSSLTPS